MDEFVAARPLRDIVGDVANDAQLLVRGEIALARAELDQKLERVIMALVWTFGGMFVTFAGLIIGLLAAVDALSFVIPLWAAFLAIGVLILAIGGGLCWSGINMLKLAKLTLARTTANVKQDARLVREHI